MTSPRAFKSGGVHLVSVPIDYSENTRVLIDQLLAKDYARHSAT
jgi:acetolactate synthase-1/2/3 large subunit